MNRYWNIKIKTLFLSVTVFVAFALLADFIEVGDRLQVMWDDHVVDNKLSTAAKRLHHPVYAGKVMTWDKPWEGDGSEFPNVVIDTDRDGNPLTYLDIISVPDTIAETVDLSVHLERVRVLIDRVLDERERQIIVLRYGLEGFSPRTQREVASFLKISRSYVSRIEKKALEKLREHFGEKPDFND